MKHWSRVLRMTRRRLGCGNIKVTLMVKLVRQKRPDAPHVPAKALLEWYCGAEKVLPPKVKTHHHRGRVDPFYSSYEWRTLRMAVLVERGARCECCGASPRDGVTVINVDHIKPRRACPELQLSKANLQVLCGVCNQGKGNWDRTDWREESGPPVVSTGPVVSTFNESGVLTSRRALTPDDVATVTPVGQLKERRPRLVRRVEIMPARTA